MDNNLEIDADVQRCVVLELHRCMRHLHYVEQIPVQQILSVMNSELIAQIAGFYGGEVAAICVELALKQVKHLSALPDFKSVLAAESGRMQ